MSTTAEECISSGHKGRGDLKSEPPGGQDTIQPSVVNRRLRYLLGVIRAWWLYYPMTISNVALNAVLILTLPQAINQRGFLLGVFAVLVAIWSICHEITNGTPRTLDDLAALGQRVIQLLVSAVEALRRNAKNVKEIFGG